jgi:hypothetical protein
MFTLPYIPRAEVAIPFLATVVAGGVVRVGVKCFEYLLAPKPIEVITQEVIKQFDEGDTGVEAGLEMLATVSKMAPRIRKRARAIGANALAMKAYLKFGRRPKSPANVIITRKYISDLLEEKVDLRLRDKIELMDMAVFLSFIPTETVILCDQMERTFAYAQRVAGCELFE